MTEYVFKNNADVTVRVEADDEAHARELAMIELHGPMTAHDRLLFGSKWIGEGLYLS
jgi:hypothetical protein